MGFCHPFDVGILQPMSCLVSCLKYSNIFLLKFYVKDEREFTKKVAFCFFIVIFCLLTFTFSYFSFKPSIDTKVWTKSETQVAPSHLCSNLIFVDFSIWNYKIIEIEKTEKNCTFPKQKHRWHAVWRLLPTCEAIWSFLIGIRNYKVIEKDKKMTIVHFQKRNADYNLRLEVNNIWFDQNVITFNPKIGSSYCDHHLMMII